MSWNKRCGQYMSTNVNMEMPKLRRIDHRRGVGGSAQQVKTRFQELGAQIHYVKRKTTLHYSTAFQI